MISYQFWIDPKRTFNNVYSYNYYSITNPVNISPKEPDGQKGKKKTPIEHAVCSCVLSYAGAGAGAGAGAAIP